MRLDREIVLQNFELAQEGPVLVGRWQDVLSLFGEKEERHGLAIFSSHSTARYSSSRFLVRSEGLVTLSMRLVEGQSSFLLTAITEKGQDFLELSAVQLPFASCSVSRMVEWAGDHKKSCRELREVLRFPGVLAEKYQRFEQGDPMAITQSGKILITPKEIVLAVGDLVTVGSYGTFSVQVCHILDETRNEYEIHQRRDA